MDRLSSKGPGGEDTYTTHLPAGRYGDVKDIANVAIFLFSPAARFITGEVIAVDGGAEHLRTLQLPYPQSVVDPDAVAQMIKPRL